MTGYTVHTGATEQFVAGWDQIFKKSRGAKTNAKPAKKGSKRAVGKKARAGVKKSKARKGARKK